MAYKALYRSYRPINFGEVIGQKHVIQTLKNALKEDKTSHAYVFCGLRGIGKTTIARILAKAVNCLNLKNGEPCNECANCKAINENSTTDIVELDAASNNGVDEIRNILEKVNFLPSALKKKVYIIDEVHMLSSAAFNALLKTLEEPPAYVMFILATTEPHKIPMTILSRCQRFDFKQLTLEELTVELEIICEKEGIQITSDAVGKIAEAAEGGMRDALSILDQASVYATAEVTSEDVDAVTGNISNDKLIDLIQAFNEDNATRSIDIVNELLNSGKEVSRLITCIIQFCRDLLLFKSVDLDKFTKTLYRDERFKTLATETDSKRLFYYIDVLVDVQNKIRFTNSQKIYLEVGIMKIINQTSEDIDILGRIQDIEERLNSGISTVSGDSTVSNLGYEQKLMILDSKVKKLSSDIERMDVKGFKDFVNSKINLLEEVSSNASTIPSLEDRINDVETKLNNFEDEKFFSSGETHSTQNVDLSKVYELINSKEESLKQDLDNLRNQISFNSSSSNNDLPQGLIERIERIENSLRNNSSTVIEENHNVNSFDYSDIQNQINELKEELSKISNDHNSMEPSFPTKRINPYLVNSNEDERSNDDINIKISRLEMEVETLKAIGNLENIKSLDQKISDLEQRISSSSNDSLMQTLNELKTNYYLLSQTVTVIGTKGTSEEVSKKITELENGLEELRVKFEELKETRVSPVVENKPEAKPEPEPAKPVIIEEEQTPKVVSTNDTEEDLTDKIYDVRILEQTLNEAFEKANREEKETVVSNWRRLEDRIGGLLAPTARILSMGSVKACGSARLIIVFPNAQLCNDLMNPKKYGDAKEALRIALGKEYDFLALPDDVWNDKREEYYNQRRIGTLSPTLTPFNNPQLRIVNVTKEATISDREKNLSKANDFFKDE